MNTKTCRICQDRPVGALAAKAGADRSEAVMLDMCGPCLIESGWENTHEDGKCDGPEGKQCWICCPELNMATAEYVVRQGTSRAGMIINVSIRADGFTKATETVAKLAAIETTGEQWETKIVKPTKRNGHVTKLVVSSTQESYELRWDDRGRFIGGTTTNEAGTVRKVRNVAEVLRLAR